MCSLCSVLGNEHWAELEGGRRSRVFRVALLNRILGHYGLSLGDWSGRIYVLRDRTGHSIVVNDLGSLWFEAERLNGTALDPLDPSLLADLG